MTQDVFAHGFPIHSDPIPMTINDKIRKFLYGLIAKYYFKRPDIVDLMTARYRSWSSLFYTGLNFMAYAFKRERVAKMTTMMLEPTNACNLRCAMCPVCRTMKREKGYLDFDLFKRIVDDNPEVEYLLLFNWGEPLLHPRIFEMIQYATQAGMRLYMTTNGTLLDEHKTEALLKSGLAEVSISLDGIGEVYEKIRGFAYSKVVANIEHLIGRRNATGSELKINLSLTLSEMNEGQEDQFRALWRDRVDRLQIQPVLYLGLDTVPGQFKRTTPCNEVWRGNIVVLWDGTVVPCCVDYEGTIKVGDAKTERLKDIINGKKMRLFRRSLLAHRFLGVCETCHEYETKEVTPRFR